VDTWLARAAPVLTAEVGSFNFTINSLSNIRIQDRVTVKTRILDTRIANLVCYCVSRFQCFHSHLDCMTVPQYYHVSSRTGRTYKGDRHPEDEDMNASTHPKIFEKNPRACNNCGKIAMCLKNEYL
jgi:hypothetical protein